jgi:hypothetical protein
LATIWVPKPSAITPAAMRRRIHRTLTTAWTIPMRKSSNAAMEIDHRATVAPLAVG